MRIVSSVFANSLELKKKKQTDGGSMVQVPAHGPWPSPLPQPWTHANGHLSLILNRVHRISFWGKEHVLSFLPPRTDHLLFPFLLPSLFFFVVRCPFILPPFHHSTPFYSHSFLPIQTITVPTFSDCHCCCHCSPQLVLSHSITLLSRLNHLSPDLFLSTLTFLYPRTFCLLLLLVACIQPPTMSEVEAPSYIISFRSRRRLSALSDHFREREFTSPLSEATSPNLLNSDRPFPVEHEDEPSSSIGQTLLSSHPSPNIDSVSPEQSRVEVDNIFGIHLPQDHVLHASSGTAVVETTGTSEIMQTEHGSASPLPAPSSRESLTPTLNDRLISSWTGLSSVTEPVPATAHDPSSALTSSEASSSSSSALPAIKDNTLDDPPDCAICLGRIIPAHHAKATLACKHEFHLSCIS